MDSSTLVAILGPAVALAVWALDKFFGFSSTLMARSRWKGWLTVHSKAVGEMFGRLRTDFGGNWASALELVPMAVLLGVFIPTISGMIVPEANIAFTIILAAGILTHFNIRLLTSEARTPLERIGPLSPRDFRVVSRSTRVMDTLVGAWMLVFLASAFGLAIDFVSHVPLPDGTLGATVDVGTFGFITLLIVTRWSTDSALLEDTIYRRYVVSNGRGIEARLTAVVGGAEPIVLTGTIEGLGDECVIEEQSGFRTGVPWEAIKLVALR